MHIVFLHDHLDQLIAHDKGKDGRRYGDNHRFGQGLQHTKNAAVPFLRRRPHVGSDFPDFGIYRVEQAGEVAHNAVN